MEQALTNLIAKEDIRDLVMAYSRAIDRKDFDLLEQLYHPGAADEHGCNPSGTAEEFFALMRTSTDAAVTLHHNITNHFIKIDGDLAEGEAYLIGYHVIDGAEGRYAFVMGARYLDKYSRVNGVWKFTNRRVLADWAKHFSSEEPSDAVELPGMAMGSSSASDGSYKYFKLFRRGER
jgi:hypothetical protein